MRGFPEGNGLYQCFPTDYNGACINPGVTLCETTQTVYTPVPVNCYDTIGPRRCGKKVMKGKCYKKKKPTVPRNKMTRKCAFSCAFCHLRTPTSSTVTG